MSCKVSVAKSLQSGQTRDRPKKKKKQHQTSETCKPETRM